MRQFVSDSGLDGDGCIRVRGEKFHYLSAVLRLVEGDMLYVRLPSGVLQQMTVAKVDGTSKVLTLSLAGADAAASLAAGPAEATNRTGSCSGPDGPASPSRNKAGPIEKSGDFHFHLFQLVPKPPKMDLIIRQATECGVSSIIPVAGEFCQKGNIESAIKKSSPSDSRWQKIITEAREQSGSPVQTETLPCKSFDEALSFWNETCTRSAPDAERPAKMAFVLYERSENTLPVHRAVAVAVAQALAQCDQTPVPCPQTEVQSAQRLPLKNAGKTADIAVMVGAEGGISPSELEKAKDSGFIPVHLETNILRCETAALYGLAVIQAAVMESDIWKLKE